MRPFKIRSKKPRLTPVKAVPAMNQAKGSRYHGDTLIRYRLAATLVRVMAIALQALMGLISKTCIRRRQTKTDTVVWARQREWT
jgi:hypothetical protein